MTEQLYQKCMNRMTEFIDECVDQQVFFEKQTAFIKGVESVIKDWEDAHSKRLPDSFWTNWQHGTRSAIRSAVMQEHQEGMDDSRMEGEDMEQLLTEISVKSASFSQLIQKIKT